MKTHMSNTKALQLYTDIMAKTAFQKHQQKLHSQKIKPTVVTHHKQQIKIVNNNKKQINQNPRQHVNTLYKNLHVANNYKCSLDNQVSKNYESSKKILKDKIKKNRYENMAKKEHQRELESQMNRVKNCKSMVQRKKDKTDPIVNPTYFMRDGDHAHSVTIEGYKKTVIKKNRPASGRAPSSNYANSNMNFTGQPTQFESQPGYAFGTVPNFSKQAPKRPQSASHPPKNTSNIHHANADDLPQCNFKALLHHVVNNKLWKDTDMKVLYVRLCHHYGEEQVDEIWEMLMDELEK